MLPPAYFKFSSDGSVNSPLGGGGSANVGNDGTYHSLGVHPDTYTVSVLNSTEQKQITVMPGKQAEVVLQLP